MENNLGKRIAEWIHKAEWQACQEDPNRFKRIHGIVLELFFERVVSKWPMLELPNVLSVGWSYSSDVSGRDRRDWFLTFNGHANDHVIDDAVKLRRINREFVTQLWTFRPEDRVYVVNFSANAAFDADGYPQFGWRIEQWVMIDGIPTPSDNQTMAHQYQQQLTNGTTAALHACANHSTPFDISLWLNAESEHLPWKLLANRCFMNFSGRYLSDVDALTLDASERCTFVEFKRKYPARGLYYRLLKQVETRDLVNTYLRVTEDFRKLPDSGIEFALSDSKLFQAENEASGCFGLDFSHAKNVDLCYEIGILYKYIIWNTRQSDPAVLLFDNLKPKSIPDVRFLLMKPSHFTGISSTRGLDSGTYKLGIRYQLMTPVRFFHAASENGQAV